MSNYPDSQDRVLVKNYMELLPLLDLLQDNINAIDSNFRLPHIFKAHLLSLMDTVTKEQTDIRKSMRVRGIRIYEEGRKNGKTFCKYQVRGYHEDFGILDGVLKARVEERLATYLGIDITDIERN
ncbi:hypothetical protein [Paenibacillus amylolyticus]|uniref:Uncharacterized protein n=1 Tax=Paenibacillus amylolyticus TaxID=1451 RepID=A0ABD8B2V1_PAEAM